MNITNRVKTAFNVLRDKPTQNSMGSSLSTDFLRNGSREPLVSEWSRTIQGPQDLYKGYAFAAIRRVANLVTQLAQEDLYTSANDATTEKAKESETKIVHPYLTVLENSTDFSMHKLWYEISTYLDLRGVYYLMALRNKSGNRVGAVQEFKLLNPYNVRRIVNEETGEVGGYVEVKDGYSREIPPHLIIEIKTLNPFDKNKLYSTADAAKDTQFTLNQSGDYTRHAIQKNLNSPGIVSINDTDIIADEQQFENFKQRITGHVKGEPIFGVGKAIEWESMQIDLDKAALKQVSEIHREELFAVTGTSKTLLGIEQSGVTRDSSKSQLDLATMATAMPRLQLAIDALNLDYKKNYPAEYAETNYTINIENPLGSDKESELKSVQVKKANFELYTQLVDKGYTPQQAAQYCEGGISLDQLALDAPDEEDISEEETPPEEQENKHSHENYDVVNALEDEQRGIVQIEQSSLQTAITNIDGRVVAQAIERIPKILTSVNAAQDITEEEYNTVLTKAQKKEFENELNLALAAFYTSVFLFWGNSVIKKRQTEFERTALFSMNSSVRSTIASMSSNASQSHVATIMKEIYSEVQKQALAGASQQEIVSALTTNFSSTIKETRAVAIARTETNRAFTMSQYEADLQFIAQNNLEGKVYKVWNTRSNDPCGFCRELASKGAIPFDEPFANLGDNISYTTENAEGKSVVKKFVVNYETPVAGNLHTNCSCDYQLIIRD